MKINIFLHGEIFEFPYFFFCLKIFFSCKWQGHSVSDTPPFLVLGVSSREQLPLKDVISPWGCLHLCHFTCLQSQAHQNLTSNCPLCEENAATHQLLVPKSQIPTTSPTNISILEPCVGPPKEGPCTYMWRSIQGMNPLPIACPSCHQSLPSNMVMPTTTSQGALGPMPLELKVNARFKGDHVSSLILYSSPSSSIDPTILDHANPTFIPQEGDVVGTIVVYSSPSGLAPQPISLPVRFPLASLIDT